MKLLSSPAYDLGAVAETMVTDIARNHERVTRDIYESVKRLVEEVF